MMCRAVADASPVVVRRTAHSRRREPVSARSPLLHRTMLGTVSVTGMSTGAVADVGTQSGTPPVTGVDTEDAVRPTGWVISAQAYVKQPETRQAGSSEATIQPCHDGELLSQGAGTKVWIRPTNTRGRGVTSRIRPVVSGEHSPIPAHQSATPGPRICRDPGHGVAD